MKVLWVCNIMLPFIAGYLNREASNKEGWLSGLADVLLDRQRENQIELSIAFPIEPKEADFTAKIPVKSGFVAAYGFYEDTANAHQYEGALEVRMRRILEQAAPDIIHCFGTEYGHTLAVCRAFPSPERILIGIQGLCQVYAKAYLADLPETVAKRVTFRDRLKRDSMLDQQKKFAVRGRREVAATQLAGNITGRTAWDEYYVRKWNPKAVYYRMNETLRPEFYRGKWPGEGYDPYCIFLSQGDYPIKGLHYMLLALPRILERYPKATIKVAGDCIIKDDSLSGRIKRSAYGYYLKRLLKEHGIQDKVRFLGRLSAGEMKEQYLSSGLFVCCSAMENSPNSLGEAMLLGMPCVAADVGGIPSLFTDGQDGILYQGYRNPEISFNNRGNVESDIPSSLEGQAMKLAESVIKIWDDPGEMLKFCGNASLHAKKTHDKEANYWKLMEIYAKIDRQ